MVALLAAALAGCIAAPGSSPDDAANVSNGTEEAPTRSAELPTSGSAGDVGAHVHDGWKGRDEIVIVDRTVTINATRTEPGGSGPIAQRVGINDCDGDDFDLEAWCLGRQRFAPAATPSDAEPRIVAPGTWKISATASWDSETITGLRLYAISADGVRFCMGDLQRSGDTVDLTAKDVGDHNTYCWNGGPDDEEQNRSMMFPLEHVDDGHARQSAWKFVVTASGGPFGSSFAAIAEGEVDWTIVAKRANASLPLEPPHPDWYADASSYHVAYGEESGANEYGASTGGGVVFDRGFAFGGEYMYLYPRNPIPPGTQEILVRVNLTNDSPFADREEMAPETRLHYRTEETWDAPRTEVTTVDGDGSTRVYRIAVPEGLTDSVYDCAGDDSRWRFQLWLQSRPLTREDQVTGYESPGAMHWAGKIEVTVAATERVGAGFDSLDRRSPRIVPGCQDVDPYWDPYD